MNTSNESAVDALIYEANLYCAAFFFGRFGELIELGSAQSIRGQGTMTFLAMDGKYYGATNKHVITDVPDELGDRVFHIALAKHAPFPYKPIAVTDFGNPDAPYDLVIYEIPRDLVESNGKRFIDVDTAVQLSEGDLALAIGFAGEARYVSGRKMSHPTYAAIAPCESVSDRKVIIRHALDAAERKYVFGGMSGGPMFAIRQGSLAPAGILFQGAGPLERGDEDFEMWVWGFPLNRAVIERTLASGAA